MTEDTTEEISQQTDELSLGEKIAGVVLVVALIAGITYGILWALAVMHANNLLLPTVTTLANAFWINFVAPVLEQVPFAGV